ncbi:MAG: hypothetical protein K2N18_02265 [Clostridia bacterium]|nr:hypothetical protein [Clostridia bacterium]
MALHLISAVSYADIVFFVILGLGVLGGVIGGLARAFKGFFKTIAVILISILVVGATVAPISKTAIVRPMTNKFESLATGWGEIFNTPVYVTEEGKYYVYDTDVDGTQYKVNLEDAAGSGLVNGTKGKLAVWLAQRFVNEKNSGKATLAGEAAAMLTTIILFVILFIVYCILLGLLVFILQKIFKSIHKSDNPAVRVADRVLGAIVSASLVLIFMMLVLAILHAMARIIPTVHEYLLNSPVCGFLYEHNPISNIFGRIFG